jgi:hypothetical protein
MRIPEWERYPKSAINYNGVPDISHHFVPGSFSSQHPVVAALVT